MSQGLSRTARGIAAAASLLVFALSAGSSVAAETRACRQLRAELAEVSGKPRPTAAQARKLDSSIATQRDQIRQAKIQARRSGCGFSLFGQGKAQCGSVNTKIGKMERNLAGLQRKRGAMSGGGNGRSRQQIQAALNANGCNGEQREAKARPKDKQLAKTERNGGSLFDQLFGGGVKQRKSIEELPPQERNRSYRAILNREGSGAVITIEPNMSRAPGEYRTVCVRTCDGYFFPMSNASSELDFSRDLENCQSSCPGTEVQLYYHRSADQERDEMVSAVAEEPYSALSTAYLYKSDTPRPEGCGCSQTVRGNFEVIAGGTPAVPDPDAEPVIPVPFAKPDAAADPETLANAEGGFDLEALRKMSAPPPAKTAPVAAATDESRIRVVGPVFLPDPKAAIDLQAPGQKEVR